MSRVDRQHPRISYKTPSFTYFCLLLSFIIKRSLSIKMRTRRRFYTQGAQAALRGFHQNFQKLSTNSIISGTYCSDQILLPADKASLLPATVSSKHQLTVRLEYKLVTLTLIHWDSRSFVLTAKQVI